MIFNIFTKKAQTSLIISIVVGFLIVFSLVVISLSQRQTQEEDQFVAPKELKETVIGIQESQTSQKVNRRY